MVAFYHDTAHAPRPRHATFFSTPPSAGLPAGRALTRANELAPENRVVLGKLQRLEALEGHRVRVKVKRRRKMSLLDDLEDLADGLSDLLGGDDD